MSSQPVAPSDEGAPVSFSGRVIPQSNPPVSPQWSEDDQPTEALTSSQFNTENFRQPKLSPAPMGMVAPGTLELNKRPTVQNEDGSHSSEYSISYGDEHGNEVLVPTVIDGRFFTPDGKKPPKGSDAEKKMFGAAISYARESGKHLGVFDNWQNADAYAEALHSTPRDPKGEEMYVAPTLHPKSGKSTVTSDTHSIIKMPTGHTIALPATLPPEVTNSIAAEVHRILSNPPQR